jgi:cytoskeleton protein RodZ
MAVPAPLVPAAPPVAEPAPTPPAEPVSVAAGEGLVQFDFSADCWTQITDANGRVLVSAVKRKGETLQVAGKAPLEVRLGFARGAQLSYNGAPVNLRNVTSGGTARVTLGQ